MALDGLRFGVVEDNPYFRRIVRTMLGGLGVRRLSEAATAEEGWEMLQREAPDILIVDWHLGSAAGGAALLDRIRRCADDRIATQAVLFLSAHSDKRHVLSALKLGANDFLVKPVSARMLYARIRRLVSSAPAYERRSGRAVPLPPGSRGGLRAPPAALPPPPTRPAGPAAGDDLTFI